MFVYSVKFGCNKVLTSGKDEEVVAITTYCESTTLKVISEVSKISSAYKHEGEYETITRDEIDLTKIYPLDDMNIIYRHHVTHFKIPVNKLSQLKVLLEKLFPKNKYILLE